MESYTQLTSDEELLAALKDPRRQNDGIRALYKQHLGSLTQYVVNNNGSEDDAQDIFQEVIVSFVHLVKEEKFRRESSIKTFLYSMNRNLWLNELKRRGRAEHREKTFEEGKLQQKNEQIEAVIEKREATKQLMAVVESLGAECKKILLLFYFENRSMKEILAETTYENEQVVRNKKYKCLKKMEETLRTQKNIYHQLKGFFHG
jgi:RNA polymerase sigma factor (sigma-70 family)